MGSPDFSETRTDVSYHKSAADARRFLSHVHSDGVHQYNLRSNELDPVVRLKCHGSNERVLKSERPRVNEAIAAESDTVVPDGIAALY
jgi:hypothetical protein